MGFRDRIKKAALPPGTVTQTEQQIAGASIPSSGTRAEPLPRDPELAFAPFPAAMPLVPALINTPRADGRADPRKYEFPVAWNLQLVEQRNVPFRTLREVADQADIVRKCIEAVKSSIVGHEWDITIHNLAISRVMAEEGVGSTEAAKLIRRRFEAEIVAAKDFWRSPDRTNGMSFQEWLSMLLEEVLVIDALAIYPNKNVERSLWSLEILDGATIKPLLNARGSRPLPPQPAFQQILWGFPRGEFTASADASGEFTADDLIYAPRTRRPFTPYGFSPVERCLSLVDLYLKRMHWFRTEFTDGVMPDLMLKSDMEFGNQPELLRGYEQVFNDALAGNMEQRRRARLLPNGFDPVFPPSSERKYHSDFDEYLVKSICVHFGIMPTQIGFPPKSGIGGKGHQEGEAQSAETLGLHPLLQWVSDLLTSLSYRFIGMSRDLAFTFTDTSIDDAKSDAERRQVELFSGQKTWNEIRTEMGLPLYGFAEADSPLLVAGATVLPLAATFEPVNADAENAEADQGQPAAQTIDGETPAEAEAGGDGVKSELATFKKWAKTERQRPFAFEHVSVEIADELNALVRVDAVAARHLAAEIGKSGGFPKAVTVAEPFPASHPAREVSDVLRKKYAKELVSVGSVDVRQLVEAWVADGAEEDDPVVWLKNNYGGVLDKELLRRLLQSLYTEAGWMGQVSANMLLHDLDASYPDGDWSGWTPGDVKAADRLLKKIGGLLRDVFDKVDFWIDEMNDSRTQDIGDALRAGIVSGLSVEELVGVVSGLLTSENHATEIAGTEMNRANTASALDVFRDADVTMVEWQTSGGPNVCEDCQQLEDDSPYRIEDLLDEPPLHPNCGCQIVPVSGTASKNVEPTLIKVRRNAVDRALKALADIPEAKAGMIDVPWPIRMRPKVKTEDWADSHIKLYTIEELFATQKYLKRDVVEWHLNHLGQVGINQNSYPNVLMVAGEPRIYDGHHRLAALWLLGVEFTNCWTLEVN